MENFRGSVPAAARLTDMETRPHIPGYRLGELIARGSSAAVWAAAPEGGGDRDLAVKVVPVGPGCDEERLAGELSALTMARGHDEHLVTVVDVVAVTEPAPAVAVVMDRLRHGTLTRLVSTRGHLTPGEVVTVLTPVALTAARLHDAALVHGDISPSNVGFDGRGRPVVLDLGVSVIVGSPRVEIYGTPGFVAPEVVAGGPPTPEADVYAMGALGWYALTGEPPPIPGERPLLDTLAQGVPPAMRRALEDALHPEPAQRCGARELATAVYGAAAAAPIEPGEGLDETTMLTHRVRELARATSASSVAPDSRAARRTALRSRSRAAHLRVAATLVAAVVIGVAGVAAAAAGRGGGTPAQADVPAGRPPAAAQDTAAPVATSAPSGDAAQPATTAAQPTTTAPQPTTTAEPTTAADATAVVEELVHARASAWTDRDVGALGATFAQDGPALANDRALLAAAEAGGYRYEGLRFAVDDVRLLVEAEDLLRVEATITTSSYAVRHEDGSLASTSARQATSVRARLTLVLTEVGWRIREVEPATA